MKELKVPGLGTVIHTGSDQEAEEHQNFLTARAEFVANYCREKGWPVPGDPGFEEAISFEQIMEIREQPGWKDPLQNGAPQETSVIVGREGAVVVPKGRN